MTTYTLCLSIIQRKLYRAYEEMAIKLNVFFLNNQLDERQYTELMELLNSQRKA